MFNTVNDKQTTDELKMSTFSSRWNGFVSVLVVALMVQYTKYILTFTSLAELFYAFFLKHSRTKKVFFKLFKRYIICFSSISELITMAGQTHKKLWVGK